MKLVRKITNGIIIIIIGLLHTKLAISPDGCGKQINEFAEKGFFMISGGMDEMPAMAGKTNFESFAAFWFFYFGILLIPLGLIVHYVERKNINLPHYFTISYLLFVIAGAYMIPKSGMTFIMLPHAIFMLIYNYLKVNSKFTSGNTNT